MAVYSHSRISSFENCPLQYRYRYIDQIKRDVDGVEALVGKVVHEVLQALYSDLARARAAGAHEFVGMFNRLWRAKVGPTVRIVRENMTLEDYRILGERCIRSFYDGQHPFEGGEVVGCETRVEFGLDPEGRFRILGFIDRIDRVAPGVYEIHDYKTGVLPRAGALKADRQLSLYEIAVREQFEGVREVRHVWHYLAHGKEFDQRRTPEELGRIRLSTIRAIQNIEATAEFPARASALCSWCEYQEICPEWAGKPTASRKALPDAPACDARSGQYLLFGGRPGR